MLALFFLVILTWLFAALIYKRTEKREGFAPLDNIGIIFILVLTLYSTLPPLVWLLQGGEYISVLSGRLFYYQPTLSEQVYLVIVSLLIILGYYVTQELFSRKFVDARSINRVLIPKKIILVCFLIITFRALTILGLQEAGILRENESYIDSYLIIQELPLFLRQILKFLGGLAFFSKLVILVWCFQSWKSRAKWVYLFIIYSIATFDLEGGRAQLFMLFFAMLILTNRFLRQLSLTRLIIFGTFGILVFLALGLYRGMVDVGFSGISISDLGIGEFNSLWANAIELRRERLAGNIPIDLSLYFSDIFSVIPSNLLPFQKTSLAEWYLYTYYDDYMLKGGGLGFGLLSQVVVGFGWIEAFFRGVLIGLLTVWLNNIFRKGSSWWCYPALLYCCVLAFQMVRDTSFALISPLFQVILIGALLMNMVAPFVNVKRKNSLSQNV